MRTMLLDLHAHTSAYSTDSNLSPIELIELAAARGLDGIVLTEHDAIWPAADLVRLSAQQDFVVLPGVEATTELGHVLVYGLPAWDSRAHSAPELRRLCDESGALMFLAHPTRDGAPRLSPQQMSELFDGLEGINGSDGPSRGRANRRTDGGLRLPPIGGSDAHAAHEVGLAATQFDADVRSVDDLLRELRAGRYRAVTLPVES